MLKSDIEWPASRRYKSNSKWEPAGFFSECLCNARYFDIMLGFFSSSAISVLADGFAAFLYNGGKMRLIINDILTEDDKNAIAKGQSEQFIDAFNLADIENIKETLSERDKHFFECLAWLIQQNRVEIKIIAPLNGVGVAHTKCGIFSDGINKVGFDGSVNFSRTAFLDNKESLTASCDWDGPTEIAKIQDIEDDFKQTFNGEDTTVKYIDATDIRTRIHDKFKDRELLELLKDEYSLLEKKDKKDIPVTVQYALQKAKERVKTAIDQIKESQKTDVPKVVVPSFPYPQGPREYQQQAFKNWKDNRLQGLFAMATGTGKTLTSLNCLLEIYKTKGYYKAIILVPTITLVEQWEEECQKFNFEHIVKVSSNNPKWRSDVANLQQREARATNGREPSYIIISTYASFAKDKIFCELNKFPAGKLLLIADEAHNMGAGQIRNKIPAIPYWRRIGLSATPERQFDEAGNKEVYEFFGASDKFTFEFNMQEAIDKGFLCKYYYYPHVVELTDSEMVHYSELSKKISKLFYNVKSKDDEDRLEALLLARKRIIHKAVNKLAVFESIIADRLSEKSNLKYSLVYVPEGNKPDNESEYFSTNEGLDDDIESEHLIDQYTKIVKKASATTTVKQFTSGLASRDETLKSFAKGDIEVLTSMKCLDEGVDVPRSEFAIFCASTGNPRQFIQRRGRILRQHKDKPFAVIHDLVVIPRISYENIEEYNVERKLVDSELRRVRNFASLSLNLADSDRELKNIVDYYNLSIF
ncbi:MAG: DEAD/DEAH box helicase family protein [Bacteroidaceae bacterium]|nr:DEAD/DEAH box helicase family protein [Bacteroidaceae bacterium]